MDIILSSSFVRVKQFFYLISYYDYYDYFDKLLRLENVKLFSRQSKVLYLLVTTILILHRKLYRNIVSIIVLNIETRQYNIKINLAYRTALEIKEIFS